MTGIKASADAYEDWLRARLGDAFVAADLEKKHRDMADDRFLFLRATCWRWAEIAPEVCPGLIDAPKVAAVGDAHIGNFGLWRDREARLVWGVNDYDEAAPAPWPFDLVRLAASALIADWGGRDSARDIAAAIRSGYRDGLAHPAPAVLDRDLLWLRDLFAASDKKRLKAWQELLSAPTVKGRPPPRFVAALTAALPEPGLKPRLAPRVAGAGSLGRMRITAALDDYRGGPLAREAKALVPSCWNRRAAPGTGFALAAGAYRSPDPWLQRHGDIVVRRLSPNSRKLDLAELPARGRLSLLAAMARDLAAVHAQDGKRIGAVRADFERRKAGWLRTAARAVAEANERDWQAWRQGR